MINVRSTCKVAKSFSVKREKAADESERIVANLKISDALVDREQLDELCQQPIGWAETALFDDMGAPRASLTLTLHRDDLTLSGVIKGGDKSHYPKLTLKGAELGAVTLELTKFGALLGGTLSWIAAGDEVDDIADMLGCECSFVVVITDGGQDDMFSDVSKSVAKAARNIRDLAQQDGIESVELQVGGKTVAKFGKDVEFPVIRDLGQVRKAAEVLLALQQGYTLVQYGDSSFRLERCVGGAIERRECWVQAAHGAIKRGLTGIAEPDSEYGQWQWKERAA